jgi:hypothetical protein
MGAAVSFTAFRPSVALLSGQPRARKRHQALVPALFFLAAILSGCAGVDVLMLSSESFTPQADAVEVLERAPTRPYVQIAVLTIDSWWLSVDTRRQKIVEKAAMLGADAVVFGELRLPAPAPGDRTAEQTPSPSLPKDSEKVMPGELHSSLRQGINADVSIYLVRGGGHGGGRGGGHHGGFRGGGWSGRHGARHWRHFSGPGWGYGFYGLGWWGYGAYSSPYWGGYYPYSYYGGYPYTDDGYMNGLTVGTAIHYTD